MEVISGREKRERDGQAIVVAPTVFILFSAFQEYYDGSSSSKSQSLSHCLSLENFRPRTRNRQFRATEPLWRRLQGRRKDGTRLRETERKVRTCAIPFQFDRRIFFCISRSLARTNFVALGLTFRQFMLYTSTSNGFRIEYAFLVPSI